MADSNHTRDDLIRIGCNSSQINVVHMGVDLNTYRPRQGWDPTSILRKYCIPSSRPIVLFVGSEHPRKNIPGLFRAFPQIQRESGAVLVKVGEPRQPQRQSLLELARSLGIANDVVYIDSVPEEDMPLLYSASDVLVLASFYEGFGLPPLEAMASGTPTGTWLGTLGSIQLDPNGGRHYSLLSRSNGLWIAMTGNVLGVRRRVLDGDQCASVRRGTGPPVSLDSHGEELCDRRGLGKSADVISPIRAPE